MTERPGLTLHLARILPAPPDRVFAACVEPAEFVLEQGRFATEARHDLHRAAWTDRLERLERHLDRSV